MTDTPTTSERLLPCPFCGPGESQVDIYWADFSQRYKVGCGRCGASTGTHPTDKTEAPAIAAWNRRPHPVPSQGDRDVLQVLQDVQRFITNGVELGYIRMPDSETPDPAHTVLPKVEAAIAKLRAIAKAEATPAVIGRDNPPTETETENRNRIGGCYGV